MSTLILDSTTKTIKVAMSGAATTTNPDFTAFYADNNGTSFTEASSDGALSGTSDVTIVAAPASGYRRIIKSIFIENKDTAPVTITVKFDNNGTQRNIVKLTLQVGDTWSIDGTRDSNGALKQTLGTINVSSATGTLAVAQGGTGGSTSTGSGSVVLATSPTLVTPVLGVATATSLNKITITAPANSANLTLVDGSSLSTSGAFSTTLTATATTNVTLPTTGTLATLAGSESLSNKTLVTPVLGVATATSLNKITITTPANSANLTLVEGSTLATSGAYSTTLTATATTNVTLPTTGTLATLAGSESLSNKTLVNPTITNYTETTYVANTSTAITVALTNGTVQILTLTGNATITMPAAVAGKSFVIILRQDGTGSRTVTWTTVKWPAATAPTITSTASKQDIFSFFSDGTSWYGTTIGQNYTQ